MPDGFIADMTNRLVLLKIYICEWSVLMYGSSRVGILYGTDSKSIPCIE